MERQAGRVSCDEPARSVPMFYQNRSIKTDSLLVSVSRFVYVLTE